MDKDPPASPEPHHDKGPARLALAVLALCFVLAAIGRGAGETFTVFLLPVSGTFGWDRAQVVSVYSIGALCSGLAAPFVGRLFDRAGPRAVYGVGMALLGAGFSAAAFARELWHLQVCIGLAAGLGAACLGNITGSLLLNRWYGPRLPAALAVVASAAGAGVLLLVPLSQILIDRTGWRGAYHILGGVLLAATIPLLLLPWRRLGAGSGHAARLAQSDAAGELWTLRAAMRHHAFWALFGIFFFTAVGMFSIAAQVVTYLVEVGFSPLQAATAWGLSGVLLLFGMLTVSWLDGLLGRRRAILASYSLTVAGILMLWALSRHPTIWLLGGFLICFGSTMGSRGPLITAAAMTIFRGRSVGTIVGTISIGAGLGSAIGALSGGLIHDWAQSYDPVFGFALASVLVGMTPFLVAPALRG